MPLERTVFAMTKYLLALLFCVLNLPAAAQEGVAVPLADDPALEERVLELSHKLRCLVCQNQSIAESNAPLAVDLRDQVREQLAAGRNENEVVDYLVDRYGDFVLYEPPFNKFTLALWLGPLLLLLLGTGILFNRLRQRAQIVPAPLTDEERDKAQALLDSVNADDAGGEEQNKEPF